MRSPDASSLNTVFGELGIEVEALAVGPWHAASASSIVVRKMRPVFRGGRDWRALHERANVVWEEHLARGRPTYGRPPEPPGLLRLVDWSLAEGGRLRLDVQPTWYWCHLGSNIAAARAGWATPPNVSAELGDLADLRGSTLANPLTVNVAVVAGPPGDRAVLIQHRGAAVANAGERYQISVGGYVDAGDSEGEPARTAWRAAVREADEETGGHVAPDDMTFLALCRMHRRFVPGLCGVAYQGSRFAASPAPSGHDRLEIDGVAWWPWDVRDIMQRVQAAGGWATFVPLGGAALAVALLREHGPERVRQEWRRVTRGS